jgi:hypothetical protein
MECMVRKNFFLPARHIDLLCSLSEQTGLAEADWIRRALDYIAQEKVLNEIVPGMSGGFKLDSWRAG